MRSLLLSLLTLSLFSFSSLRVALARESALWWEVQSIDTMKYSRDISREKLKDPSFNTVIDRQVKDIAQTGATHAAVGTPYDAEFLPFLKRWVATARKYNLKVWFRGNWSGWEGWFDYPSINRETHLAKTREFILKNKDLFEDGDIFTPCPECENGGPGDPRRSKDVKEYRNFLIEEYQVVKEAFQKIGKKAASNYNSMNGDVARLIMDKETTKALDGVVVIDHYVEEPSQLSKDIREIASRSGGKIILGEFGAPITDIHGKMSEKQQAAWIENALRELVKIPDLIGLNYWVAVGGTSQIWKEDGTPKEAVEIIHSFYTPKTVKGVLKNEIGRPVVNAIVTNGLREVKSDIHGYFKIPYLAGNESLKISAENYLEQEVNVRPDDKELEIVLKKTNEGYLFKTAKFFNYLFNFLNLRKNLQK